MDIQQHYDTLASDPGNMAAFEAILESVASSQEWGSLSQLYQQSIDRLEDDAEKERLIRLFERVAAKHPQATSALSAEMGKLYWKSMGSADKAERSFRRVQLESESSENLAEISEFYENYYAEKDNWRRLEQFFEQVMPETEQGPNKAYLKRRIAGIAERHQNAEKAIYYWQAVRTADGADNEAREKLERLYTEAEKWHSLVDLYKADLNDIPDDDVEAKLVIYRRMIEIYRDQIKSENMVTNTYQAILQIAPTDSEAIEALIEQYEAMRRWPALIEVLQKKAEVVTDTAKLVDVHMQIATLFLDRFSNQTEAIKSYEKILELDPAHVEVIKILKGIYEKRRDWAKYVEITAKEIESGDDPSIKAHQFAALADLANDKLRRPQVSAELWASVLKYDETNAKALEELDQLHERDRDYEALAGVLEKRLSITDAVDQRVELLQRLGQVYGDRLDRTSDAIRVWRDLLALDPEHRRAKEELKKKYLTIQDWDALEEFFQQFGTTDQYIRVLEQQVKVIEEAEAQISLLFKIAGLYLGELDSVERAIQAYEQILELDAHHNGAALALIPIYESRSEWQGLARVREIQLGNLSEPMERQPVFFALCGIYEQKLSDADTAYSYYLQAFVEDFRNAQILAAIERLAPQTHRFTEFAEVMEQACKAVTTQPLLKEYHLRVAQLYADKLDQPEQSLAHHLTVLGFEPDNMTALDAVEALYNKLERWDDLLGTLQKKLSLATDPHEQKRLRLRSARVYRDRKGDLPSAIELLQQVSQEFPNDLDVLEELGILYLTQDDVGQLVSVLDRKLTVLNQTDEPDKSLIARVKYQLGMLAYGKQNDTERAIDYYREALENDPKNLRAVELLEELIGDENNRQQIALILEGVYEQNGWWEKLVDVLEIQLSVAELVDDRVALLERIGELNKDRRGDNGAAFVAFGRLFMALPAHSRARGELEGLSALLDNWETLVQLYEAVVNGIDDAQLKVSVYLAIARVYYEQLSQLEPAEANYRKVLEIDPANAEALDNLENLYMRIEDDEKLLETLRLKLAHAFEVETKREISFRVADLLRYKLDRLEEAIGAIQHVFDFEPEDAAALEYLDDLYMATQNWAALADVLERRILQAPTISKRADLQLRLAECQESFLSNAAAAIDIYQHILLDNGDEERAIENLERLFQNDEHKPVIAPILEPIYERRHESSQLISVHRVQIGSTFDLDEKVDLLHKIARLYEESEHNVEDAFATYAEAFRINQQNEDTLEHLKRLADVLNNYPELVQLLQGEVEKVEYADLAGRLHMLIARLCDERCLDSAGAEVHYRKVLEFSPDDEDAIDALIAIFQQGGNADDLVSFLERKAALVPDVAEKIALLFQAAEILLTRLENPGEAVRVLQKVLDIDPHNLDAINNLETLYLDSADYASLVEIYSRKAELAEDPEDKKQILYRKGSVFEDNLDNLDDAIDTYRKVLDWEPDDLEALGALDRLFSKKEDWLQLLEVLERLRECYDATERQEITYRIGTLYEEKLDDTFQAIESYRVVLETNPNHMAAIESLEGIIDNSDAKKRAIEVLEPIYREFHEWEKLIRIYEVLVQHLDIAADKITYLHQIGEIYNNNVRDHGAAFHAYSRAFREDPMHEETRQVLESIAEINGDWQPLVDLYESELSEATDDYLLKTLGLKLASVYEMQLNQDASAIEKYELVYQYDPSDRVAVEALDRLYQRASDWEKLAAIIDQEIMLADSDDERIEFYSRMGRIYEEFLNDSQRALDSYQAILNTDGQNEQAILDLYRMFTNGYHRLDIARVLEPIFREREEWASLNNLYEGRLDEIDDRFDKITALKELADLNLEQLFEAERGLHWLGKAFQLDPLDESVRERMEALAEDTMRWGDIVEIYSRVKEEVEDAELMKQTWHRIARILEEKVGDAARAEQTYLDIRMSDPDDLDVLKALDKMYEGQSRWTDLVDVLEEEIKLLPYQDEKVQCMYRLGLIYHTHLRETDKSLENYREILTIDPNYEPALVEMAQIYRDRGEWESLFATLRSLSDVKENVDEKAVLLEEMAGLAEEVLANTEEAIALRNEILMLKGEDVISLTSLLGLYQRQEMWADYVDVTERLIAQYDDEPPSQVQLFKNLGIVFRDRLDRPASSTDAWTRVLELEPTDLDALEALRELYRDAQEYDKLVDVLERLIELYGLDALRLKELYTELGEIKTEIMMIPHEAIEVWVKVLGIDPNDLKAINALEKLYQEQAMWSECIEIIERKVLNLTEGEEIVASLLVEANIWFERMGNPQQATQVYERIRQLDPANLEASRLLEGLYREHRMWTELVDLYLDRLNFIEENTERVDLCHQIARLYEEELSAYEEAFSALKLALEMDPANQITLIEIERLAEITQNWMGLIESLDGSSQLIEDESQSVELLVKIAELYEKKMGQDAHAVAYFRVVLERQPDNLGALRSLAAIYERIEKWEDLVDIFKIAIALLDDYDEKVQMLYKMGDVCWKELFRLDEAIEAFKAVLGIDEFDERALKALESLYAANENWIELIDILHKQASLDSERATDLKLQIASIWEEKVQSTDRAIEIYREIVHFESTNEPALKALETLYRKQENWRDLLDIYELLLDIAPDNDQRCEYYREIAQIWEREFSNKESAVDAYRKVISLNRGDEAAIRELERLFNQLERWTDLVEIYRLHIEVTEDPTLQVQLYQSIGGVFSDRVIDVDKAIESHRSVLEIDPENMKSMGAMAELYARNYDWDNCLQTYDRMIRTTDDTATRLDLYHKRGLIFEEHLMDLAQAEQQFTFALQLEPYFTPGIESLKRLYTTKEDWPHLVKMMKLQEESAQGEKAKADRLFEIARVYEEKLNDLTNAVDYYEKTLEFVPDHEGAAKPLVEMYLREKKWERAEPLLDMIVSKTGALADNEYLCDLHFKLGKTAENLLNDEKALEHYKLAHEYDPNHLETLKGLARLNLKREYWDLASRNYRNLLVSHRDSLASEDLVEIYCNLGQISLKLGDRKKAINYFERVLEYDAAHEETLMNLVDLFEKLGEWRRVIKHLNDLAAVKADDLEKFHVILNIGDLYRDKLRDNNSAVATYREALQFKPDSKVIMVKLLEIFIETTDYSSAIETLEQMTKIETDPTRLGNSYYTMAAIYRDQINDEERAIEYYNMALDADPGRLKAFESIERLLTKAKAWKELERNYRKMIQRVLEDPEQQGLLYMLFSNLGEIYRSRMGELDKAVAAFKSAAKLRDDDHRTQEIICQLLDVLAANDAGFNDMAVEEHRKLLLMKPGHIASYKALNKHFLRRQDYDAAWAVCSLLVTLNQADTNERNFYAQHRQNDLPRFTQAMDYNRWLKYVFHEDLDPYIGAIFALITPVVHSAFAFAPNKQMIKRKYRLDLNDGRVISNTFKQILQVLGLPAPELFFKDEGKDMQVTFTNPVRVFVSQELLRGVGQKEVGFMIGHRLTFMLPQFFLLTTGSKTFLTNCLYAALAFAKPGFQVPSNDETNSIKQALEKLDAAARSRLESVVNTLIQGGAQVNIKQWLHAVELTAIRSGLLVANDYGVAIQMLKTHPELSSVAPQDAFRELALYALSDKYLELRKLLGISIS
ncbi:MAG: tetratricopeptide repeat protein [Myxococcales bacterium]|nr:tetratricopeptide repeat protein [Myxococcales bacterium]